MYKLIEKIRRNKNIQQFFYAWSKLHTIALFFGVLFFIVIVKLFTYTVVEGKYYEELANKQQIGEIQVPVNRGMIYSSVERGESGVQKGGAFATSINLYNIAVDPTMEGSKDALGKYLVDMVYFELCSHQKTCENKLLQYLKVDELEDYRYNEGYIKELLTKYIFKKISQTRLTSVLIDKELTEEQIQKIEEKQYSGIYLRDAYIYVNPEEVLESSIQPLSEIMHINFERLKFLMRKRELRYVPIIDKLSIVGSEKLKKFLKEEEDALRRGLISDKKSISNFFILEAEATRYYPEGDIASQIIGFVDKSGVGHYGLEGYYNNLLKGNSGTVLSAKDVHGRVIDPVSFEEENDSQKGIQIVTTIDRNVQKKVEEIIKRGVINYRAVKGTIVVTDPKTGKIIAMANYPTYDINDYGNVYEMEKIKPDDFKNPSIDLLGYPIFVEDSEEGKPVQFDGEELLLREAKVEELGDVALVKYRYKNWFGSGVYQNDAISSIYEPGSIMKAITVAMGIDAGEVKSTDMYNDLGFVKIDGFTISNDSQEKCNGYHSYQNALNFSCNVGMIRIIQRMGKALSHRYFEEFGFTTKTGIELSGEVTGSLIPWERMSTANLLTRSFGLGISATPLQMASAYNVLGNGGIYMKPQIIDKIIYPDGRVQQFKPEQKRRVIKESTSKIISKMLYEGVEVGFAEKGKVEGYSLAGKTGTAQIFYKGAYQSGAGWTNASYAGYGPVEDPEFTIVVKLERPKANAYGGQTSSVLFRNVAEYLFTYYNIPKKTDIPENIKTDA